MKKLLAILLLFPALAFAQFQIGSGTSQDSVKAYGTAVASADIELIRWTGTKKVKDVFIFVKVDTTALDSVAFYAVLEASPTSSDSNWIPIDSTTTSITTVVMAYKAILNVGAPNLRIRINALAGNSRAPTVPYSAVVILRRE